MLNNTCGQGSAERAPDRETRPDAGLTSTSTVQSTAVAAAKPGRGIVEYEAAKRSGAASFNQLAAAILFSQLNFTPDPRDRAIYEGYIEDLTEAFEAAHGHITHSLYCERTVAAAVLTDRLEFCAIYSTLDAKDAGIADMLLECDRLNVEADRVLAGAGRLNELQTTKTLIYAAVTRLLSLLDAESAPPRPILEVHRREVGNAKDYYLRAATRHAKFDYFLGMLIGGALSALVIAASASALRYASGLGIIRTTLIGCLTAGGVGAVISVMSRMTFGEFTVDYEAGRRILLMLGAFRPVIGMVLGAAMWVLSASGVLAIGPTSDKAQVPFFQILIAFLAGFSERWAQDMLGRTADEIGGRGGARRNRRKKGNQPSN